MNTTEHLAAIVRHIDKLLAIAEKRTPGKWTKDCGYIESYDGEEIGDMLAACSADGDIDFIASCAGNAEAGWRATKAAIEAALDCQSWDGMIKEMYIRPDAEAVIDAILAAWPIELLKEDEA